MNKLENKILKFVVSLQKKKLKKQANIIMSQLNNNTEPPTPGGNSVPSPQYGLSGNDLYAGGANAIPYSTRVQELIEQLKKLQNK